MPPSNRTLRGHCNHLSLLLCILTLLHFGFGSPQNSVPTFKTTLAASNPASFVYTWSGECFQNYTGTFSMSIDEGILSIDVTNPKGFFCEDILLFADLQELRIERFAIRGPKEIKFKWKEGEYQQVMDDGLQVFQVTDGIIGELFDIFEFYRLLAKDEDPKFVVDFLQENAGWNFTQRAQQNIVLNKTDVMSGDYLAMFNLDGNSLLITYGTGSHTDHVGIALWVDGELYVVESTAGYGVRRSLWDDWVLNRPPEIHIALLRLAPEYLSLFNETAANEWFLTVEGLSYGWDNFMFGWIDTATQNYPYPLSEEILPIAMSIVDRLAPQYSQFYLNGLNKRLGTANLTTEEIFALLPQRGLNFTDLMVMVEQDSWDYGKGPSMVCSVFAMDIYRAGGIFSKLPNLDFQAAEFTPKDSYQIQIFDTDWERPQPCLVDRDIPYCQLTGEYLLLLPGFSSIPPYSNMNNLCGALPPSYVRTPVNC